MGFFDLFKKKQNTQPTTPAERSQPTSPENHRPAAVENNDEAGKYLSPAGCEPLTGAGGTQLRSGRPNGPLLETGAGRCRSIDHRYTGARRSGGGAHHLRRRRETTVKIIERIEARVARDKYMNTSELQSILRDEIAQLMEGRTARPKTSDSTSRKASPYVIMVVGVNGAGKTTTIGKLAAQLTRAGLNVYRRCGYVPCGRHRPVGRMGRTGRRHDDPSGDGLRSGVGGLRHLEIGRGEQGRRRTDRHGGPPAKQGRPDERADQDPQRDGQVIPQRPQR